MFNHLSNATQHRYTGLCAFQVEIDGGKLGMEFVIRFRDWGPGIRNELEETIFEAGFRAPEAIKRDVTGQGLGLWVVRQVVEAHGGRIKVTKNHLPTEFTIFLPESLAWRSPQSTSS